MKITNTSSRLNEYMDLYNLRQVDVLNACEPLCKEQGVSITRGELSHYMSGKFEPKQDKLLILSDALNVSVEWLMGCDVPMRPNASEQTNFSKLDEIDQAKISERIDIMLEAEKYQST